MVAKKTPSTKPATEKAEPKKRQPKAVTDLPSATTALKAAQRRADRADKAYDEARTERYNAQSDLAAAKATVKKFYAELMGENLDVDEDQGQAEGPAYVDERDETSDLDGEGVHIGSKTLDA